MDKPGFKYSLLRAFSIFLLDKNEEPRIVRAKFINNTRNIWGSTAQGQHPSNCKEVEPYIVGDLHNRYFKIHRQNSEGKWHKLFANSSPHDSKHPRCAPAGSKLTMEFYLEPKEYCPSGDHQIKFGVRYKKSKQPIKNSKQLSNTKVKVVVHHNYDKRMETLENIGQVDYKYSNKLFKQLKPSSDNTPIIMAIWKRIERLDTSLEAFGTQNEVKPVLYLWVNNREVDKQVKQAIDKAKIPVVAYFSQNNIGGYGRFYLARDIMDTYDRVIFIDDDQVPKKGAFKTMNTEFRPDEIRGIYADQIPLANDYWYRREIRPGQKADYIGTCGMICPLSIFADEKLFECPRKYWFIEDLWLCWFANTQYGWELLKSAANIETVNDQKDQFRPMIDLKNEFFRYLVKRGQRTHP